MSITIHKEFKVGPTLTDVTTYTLGIVRADTEAVVTAAGTAMTHAGTGIYTYTFTAPAAGLTYTTSYNFVYNGRTIAWSETYEDASGESIPLPELTGDVLVDTYNSLRAERLKVARDGPKFTYDVDGQKVDWNGYMEVLEKRMLAIRIEIAQSVPLEEIGIAW